MKKETKRKKRFKVFKPSKEDLKHSPDPGNPYLGINCLHFPKGKEGVSNER